MQNKKENRAPTQTQTTIIEEGSGMQVIGHMQMQAPEVERVYIGGLDPARGLTVKELLDRLEVDVKDRVRLQHEHEREHEHVTTCFCHLNAISLEEDKTALEIIRKLYNNVVWKGCKIKVQAAKPHILERLARERKERADRELCSVQQQQQQQHQQPNTGTNAEEAESGISGTNGIGIPRHLKIKRGHGQQHWKVDTKPCTVVDWDSFSKMRKRLLLKHQKHQQQQRQQQQQTRAAKDIIQGKIQIQGAPTLQEAHWNRAVHLRFTHTHTHTHAEPSDKMAVFRTELDKNTTTPPSSSSATSSSSSASSSSDSSSSSSSSSLIEVRQQPKGAYIWSDSETEVASDLENEKAMAFTQPLSDGESSQDSMREDTPGQFGSTAQHSPKTDSLDEFAAGIVDDDVSTAVSSETSTEDRLPRSEHFNLEKDIEANLSILGEIFPDLVGRKVNKLEAKGENKATAIVAPGWTSTGQMLRFDPTKQQSAELLLRQESESKDGDAENEQGSDCSVDQESTNDSSNTEVESSLEEVQVPTPQHLTAQEKHIYEQGKLEQVFRAAREQDTEVLANNTEEKGGSEGGFTFGFDLNEAPESSAESNTFSFAFSVGTEHKRNAEDEMVDNHLTFDFAAKAPTIDDDQGRKRQRQGLVFPERDIDEYVRLFYSLNDGERMRNNLEEFRKDSKVQESWEKQRRILTVDWKRKRKYALSQKRTRFLR